LASFSQVQWKFNLLRERIKQESKNLIKEKKTKTKLYSEQNPFISRRRGQCQASLPRTLSPRKKMKRKGLAQPKLGWA
jgi:hypothetical protein